MAKEFTDEDDALLAELGVDVEKKKAAKLTPREERIIAGFEEIQRFVDEHGRPPRHGEDNDIFERIYAVRLDQLRKLEEAQTLLVTIDHQGILRIESSSDDEEELDDDELLAELGIEASTSDISELKHVRSSSEKKAAEEIANREKCEDFKKFKPLFDQVKRELDSSVRITRVIRKGAGFLKTDIKEGEYFILGGQTLYVAEMGEEIEAPNGESDARLRIIYSNGTESNLLQRSLQRALYKDDTSRRISEPNAGPLFSDEREDDDLETGTIYVLRSQSDHPEIDKNREVLHKIGVTGGGVSKRIAGAADQSTYLLADVEVVATYKLHNINRTKLENLLHKIFAPARWDIEIKDRFGKPVHPREWFLVPLQAIDEAVERIKDGSIRHVRYNPDTAQFVGNAGSN